MNYQQVQKIEVIVRKEGGNGEKGNKTTEAEDAGKQNGEQSTSTANAIRRKRFVITNATHAYAVAKQFASAEINYRVGSTGFQHGDEAYQERVGRQMEVVNDATNAVSSIGMGITYGSFAGPWGAVLGGVFGALSQGISIGYKYKGRERDFSFKMFKQNNAIEYKRARANINLTTGRLR